MPIPLSVISKKFSFKSIITFSLEYFRAFEIRFETAISIRFLSAFIITGFKFKISLSSSNDFISSFIKLSNFTSLKLGFNF